MRYLIATLLLGAGCSVTIGGQNDTGTDTGGGGGGTSVFNEIGQQPCAYSAGECLIIPGRVIGASANDAMAIAGTRLGSDAAHLSNTAYIHDAAIGWCNSSDVYDVCYATSARVEGNVVAFEFPLQSVELTCDPHLDCGAKTIPDGFYRLSARRVINPRAFDFADGLQVAYMSDVIGWGQTDGDVGKWVWKGIDPNGDQVTDVVIELRNGRYYPAAYALPADLRGL